MAAETNVARESSANPINSMRSGRRSPEEERQIRQARREFQDDADTILYDTLQQIGREDLYGRDIELMVEYDRERDKFAYYLMERGRNAIEFDVDGSLAPLEDAIWEIANRH